MKTARKNSKTKNGGGFTAYTDKDRVRKLTTEPAILAEYRKLKLPPVVCGGLLLSPALVELLQAEDPDYLPPHQHLAAAPAVVPKLFEPSDGDKPEPAP